MHSRAKKSNYLIAGVVKEKGKNPRPPFNTNHGQMSALRQRAISLPLLIAM
jgi:hypothetical protein